MEQVHEFVAHEKYASVVAFVDEGRLLTAGVGGLKLWRVAEWERPLAAMAGHTASVDALAVSADGALAVSGSVDGTARLWDIASGSEIRALVGHKKTVAGVALSSDGARVATASYDRTARIWDTSSGTEIAAAKHPANVVAVAFSPDGSLLATGGIGAEIRLWSREGADVGELLGHEGAVAALAFSPDGMLLYSTGADDTLLAHAVDDWKVVRRAELSAAGVHQLAISPDARLVAVSVDRGVDLVDPHEGSVLETLPVPVKGVYGVAWSKDGELLAVACADGRVRLWRTG